MQQIIEGSKSLYGLRSSPTKPYAWRDYLPDGTMAVAGACCSPWMVIGWVRGVEKNGDVICMYVHVCVCLCVYVINDYVCMHMCVYE